MYAICAAEDGRHIGNLKLGPINWNHMISDMSTVIGDRSAWGQGRARNAIRLGIRIAFDELKIRKLSASIDADNIGSIKAYTGAGFHIEASLKDQFMDQRKRHRGCPTGCMSPASTPHFATRKISEGMTTRIIAEIAQGYEGRPDYCDFYVRAAAKAGADAVKFQIVYADDVAEPGYQYYDWFKKLEMDISVWKAAKARATEKGILLFTDVSGDRALRVAEAIRPDGIKIHSSNFFNRAVIRKAFDIAGHVFVSLGGVARTKSKA